MSQRRYKGMTRHKPWTEFEIAQLATIFGTMDRRTVMAQIPDRTWSAIMQRAKADGLTPKDHRDPWTGAELKKLREMYPSATWNNLLAALPRRNRETIQKMANKVRLRRDGSTRHSPYRIVRDMRALRRRLGITTAQLAKKIGAHRVQISKWERGETYPRFRTFMDWVQALNRELELK